jgi:hypothetical protein
MRLLYGCLREWQLLFDAITDSDEQGNEAYNPLLRSLFLYEYRNAEGRWFGLNPVQAKTKRYRLCQAGQLSTKQLS